MTGKILSFAAMFIVATAFAAPNANDVKVSGMFSDNMVLQRGMKVPVWGTATAGGTVEVKFAGQTKEAKVGADNKWMIKLSPMKAGGPFKMTVSGTNTQEFKNTMVGDVWICSGQSNMQFSVRHSMNSKKEITEADYPNIRLYTAPKKVSVKPLTDIKGQWSTCSPSTVKNFSAVGYFFGRDLYKDLKVPIGLIHTSWGGTPAESWTTFATLENDPDFKPITDKFKRTCADKDIVKKNIVYKEYQALLKKTRSSFGKKRKEIDLPWIAPGFDDKDWKTMQVPGGWQKNMKNFEGIVNFRKEIEIPADWAGKDLAVSLGAIDEYDRTYFNGHDIGSIGRAVPSFWTVPRKYIVPGKFVKAGKAELAVYLANEIGEGGFVGKPEEMHISLKDGGKEKSLAGEWKYLVKASIKKMRQPIGPEHPRSPAGLYNAMINPIIPYAIKGAIWYQGESNASRAYQYRKLLPAMINDWRKNWKQGDFPFLIVQLANFTAPPKQPGDSTWAELREAQTMTAESLPNSGQALAIDIGEAKDIHPKNKQDVGHRLALAARKIAYGQNIVYSGPMYKAMKVEGNKIILSFKHVGGGLISKGGPLKQFAIAGKDKKFAWANAKIEGDKVAVWSDKVKNPVAVRYAWANNPEGCNLYNKEGLPAVPFGLTTGLE